jgi:hypothetical protein
MPSFDQAVFPTVETIMDLARSIVNDMFPGVGGQNGRILTDDAKFTLPYFNSALKTLQRKLRNEGCTFPIKDNVILFNLTPVVAIDPTVQTFVGFNGYFDGTAMHATPMLPSDCIQVVEVEEQTVGNTQMPFIPMTQPQGKLVSTFQGQFIKFWEWRQYQINMIGATVAKNLRIRYTSGQPPINAPPASFPTTVVNIIDSEEALAYLIAEKYAQARGVGPDVKEDIKNKIAETIDDMSTEWVRRQQSVTYRRAAYGDGGSDSNSGGTGGLGQTGWGI